ncbi:hypothetical protein TAMA11512_08800 [Selenomonas sp. TAMA-11512]|uniref:hypothetical protein n=1 Tax=Selenomonas sp. TAMA-11512 TaxID=3095337 RepID=UPI00308D228E|nr:hypothetical protein TAMA11512_08800 [Selenomonas sp. TAMA-11512]
MTRQNIITTLLVVAICALSVITYQQQNYIESLHKIVQKNRASFKKHLKAGNIENSVRDIESSILDLEDKVRDLDDRVTDLDGGGPPPTEEDYKRWEAMGLKPQR